MCVSCGCGGHDARVDGHHHHHSSPDSGGLGIVHCNELGAERALRIEQDILSENNAQAALNRQRLAALGIFAINIVSSPGSGKTALLEHTIRRWKARTPLAVVEGDQQTANDANRIRAAGGKAVQINTGKGCHLDARMLDQALNALDAQSFMPQAGLLLIENVGNLVCPAAFDLGEAHKVVILSVTEGTDKPLKYPDMFRAADLLLISKSDLLPYVEFDVNAAVRMARRIRPGLPVMVLSSKSEEGFAPWLAWLRNGCENSAKLRS